MAKNFSENDDEGNIILYHGELICRVEDCAAETPYSSTNNLRKHLKEQHDDLVLKKTAGGATSFKQLNEAIQFYKSLEFEEEAEEEEEEVRPRTPKSTKKGGSKRASKRLPEKRLPPLPMRKDGQRNCDNAKVCCTDSQFCNYFDLFYVEEIEEAEDNEEEVVA
ncbi:uncharacterized protein ARB_04712 [Trichophyton benhamiae CBS 112371]|uniref:BED-type domain-containing protein n=1 Tax=Arthroderma benhamiae (strain ATCC MYA-4681 / CBS 112371) TaxID=663331 RepID=D4AM22_ARTBC|nr:uncharacterized protein ARB_04712 [Trichophyton benhamiae CBS 112371]EFE35778.1 hypothetical protein ARB_04712 [Trichophyton benhamiae CBS 112371]